MDLLVVADDLTLEELYRRLAGAEKRLHRKVNPTLYTRDEYRRRREAGNHFLEKLLTNEHIVLTGGVDVAASTPEPRR